MKKLPQSAGAKVQNSLQRKQRHNYQVSGTKKWSVSLPVPEKKMVGKTKRNVANAAAARRPYKLHDRTINALIKSIKSAADAPIEVHCGCAGIDRETNRRWRRKAEAEPAGVHAKQMAKVDKALYEAWRRLHEAAVRHKPTEVLFRRHHDFYPSEKLRLDMTSGEMPIAAAGNFTVLLELHPPADVSQQQPEKAFEVQEATGQRWKWTPEEDKRRRPGDNGKLP